MEYKKLQDAIKAKLIRLSQWLDNTAENRKYLEDSHTQVMLAPKRQGMFIKHDKTSKIALYVDNIAETQNQGPRTKQVSKSGTYMSIRHLAETLFAKNPDLSLTTFKARMLEEYPEAAPAGDKCYGHWCWYRHHLVMQGNFICTTTPDWVKKRKK